MTERPARPRSRHCGGIGQPKFPRGYIVVVLRTSFAALACRSRRSDSASRAQAAVYEPIERHATPTELRWIRSQWPREEYDSSSPTGTVARHARHSTIDFASCLLIPTAAARRYSVHVVQTAGRGPGNVAEIATIHRPPTVTVPVDPLCRSGRPPPGHPVVAPGLDDAAPGDTTRRQQASHVFPSPTSPESTKPRRSWSRSSISESAQQVHPPRRSRAQRRAFGERTRYSHALCGLLVSGAVSRVPIIPHGQALRVTYQRPEDEQHNHSEAYLRARLVGAMGGGRATE